MTKAECLLLIILLNLMGLVGFFICCNRVWRSETHYEIERLHKQIEMMGEKQSEVDGRQDNLINAIIKTEAMTGKFDRKN